MTLPSRTGRFLATGKGPGSSPWSNRALSLLGVVSFVALWWIGSRTTTFVPRLEVVAAAIPDFLTKGDPFSDIAPSIVRVIGALAIAVVVGFAAAYLMARGGLAGLVVSRYVDVALGVPSTIGALLALYIFKRSEIGVYVVVAFTTFPFVAITLFQGLKAADRRLTDMGRVYRFGTIRHVRAISIPHLVPYTLSAIRNEYAHAWRVVVLAEIFAVNSGIGWRFSQAYDRFLLVQVALWLITFMVILLGTEYLILRPIEKYALRWRGSMQ